MFIQLQKMDDAKELLESLSEELLNSEEIIKLKN